MLRFLFSETKLRTVHQQRKHHPHIHPHHISLAFLGLQMMIFLTLLPHPIFSSLNCFLVLKASLPTPPRKGRLTREVNQHFFNAPDSYPTNLTLLLPPAPLASCDQAPFLRSTVLHQVLAHQSRVQSPLIIQIVQYPLPIPRPRTKAYRWSLRCVLECATLNRRSILASRDCVLGA